MMKRHLISCLAALVLGTGIYLPDTVNAANESNAEVQAAVDRFYVALNAMFTGDTGLMEEVWAHSDDVTYMGPDGTFVAGWEKIREVWKMQAAKKMGGKVTADQMRIISGNQWGVTHNYENGENFDADGKPVKVSIRATNIFHKNEAGEWKMISHHTDLLPFLVEDSE